MRTSFTNLMSPDITPSRQENPLSDAQRDLVAFLGDPSFRPRDIKHFRTFDIPNHQSIAIIEGLQLRQEESQILGLVSEDDITGIRVTVVLLDNKEPDFLGLLGSGSIRSFTPNSPGFDVVNNTARSIFGGGYRGFHGNFDNPDSQQKQLLRQQYRDFPNKEIVLVLAHGVDIDGQRIIAGINATYFFHEIIPQIFPDHADIPAFIDMACSTKGEIIEHTTLPISRYWAPLELVTSTVKTEGISICIIDKQIVEFTDRPAPADRRDFWGWQ